MVINGSADLKVRLSSLMDIVAHSFGRCFICNNISATTIAVRKKRTAVNSSFYILSSYELLRH